MFLIHDIFLCSYIYYYISIIGIVIFSVVFGQLGFVTDLLLYYNINVSLR